MVLFSYRSVFAVIITAISLSLFSGCFNNKEVEKEALQAPSFKPFIRVAEVNGDWSSVSQVATQIAEYISNTDESKEATIGAKTDWEIVGEAEKLQKNILSVPLSSGKKLKLIELCNREYAEIVMEAGSYHAPALPCEIAIHSQNGKIYIDILNPEVIFGLFFADTSENTMRKVANVPSAVKSEIEGIVEMSLRDREGYKKLAQYMGPEHKAETFQKLFKEKEPLIVVNYNSSEKSSFSQEDVDHLTHSILNSVLIHGHKVDSPEAYYKGLGAELSSYDWITPRHDPIKIPGGTKVIEFCSPKYAKMAMNTGVHHATALPCEVAVTRSEDGKQLQISFLNPKYMFGTLFEDAVKNMSDEDKSRFATLPDMVLSDLEKIVNIGVKNSGLGLSEAK
jgi:uncharacterized protein (DUF302 family)